MSQVNLWITNNTNSILTIGGDGNGIVNELSQTRLILDTNGFNVTLNLNQMNGSIVLNSTAGLTMDKGSSIDNSVNFIGSFNGQTQYIIPNGGKQLVGPNDISTILEIAVILY